MATILVVDNEATFVDTAATVLRAQGHRVQSAVDGRQALAIIEQERPDLVVLDVSMSYVVGGVDLTVAMSRDAALQDIPIMMVSGLPDPNDPDAPRRLKCLSPEERAARPRVSEALFRRVADFLQ